MAEPPRGTADARAANEPDRQRSGEAVMTVQAGARGLQKRLGRRRRRRGGCRAGCPSAARAVGRSRAWWRHGTEGVLYPGFPS
jgi:hypothetical protein